MPRYLGDAATADGRWAHVPGRLKSSPAKPRATTSTISNRGARSSLAPTPTPGID
jgi:hypothetical protein